MLNLDGLARFQKVTIVKIYRVHTTSDVTIGHLGKCILDFDAHKGRAVTRIVGCHNKLCIRRHLREHLPWVFEDADDLISGIGKGSEDSQIFVGLDVKFSKRFVGSVHIRGSMPSSWLILNLRMTSYAKLWLSSRCHKKYQCQNLSDIRYIDGYLNENETNVW